MKISRKQFLESTLALAGAALGVAACAPRGTGAPGGPSGGVKSCGAEVSVAAGHRHAVDVPASDVNAGAAKTYRTSVVDGHSHEVMLSAAEMGDLGMGGRARIETTMVALA